MRCSNCSIVLTPIVAIDIDGTLGNYHAHLARFAEAYMGMNPGESARYQKYHGAEKFSEWFCREWQVDITTFRQIKLAYRQGAQKRSMPPYTGCTLLVSALRSAGAEVWLTTTRPYLRLDNVDPDTRFWLAKHAIEYDGILYDEDKYKILAERVAPERVVAVLDDLPEQYDAAVDVFGKGVPILRHTIYNRDVRRATSITGLDEACQVIRPRIDEWKEQHQ